MNEGLLRKLHNLTLQDYRNGNWSIDNVGEDELFNQIAPNITDLIREISVKKTNDSEGDRYINITVKIYNESSFEDHGIELERKDYYHHLKTYCISFRCV